MKRNFKLGLILGIAILMLLPVYARAQIILSNLQGCIAPGTVANITAIQDDTISFVVTSPPLLPKLSMFSDPEPGVTTFPNSTNGTSTFRWPTGDANSVVVPGPFVAVFQATDGTQYQYLVVMITINSTGGSPSPAPTETISTPTITVTPTPGISGQPVNFAASATSSSGDPLQYNFIWGDGTSTGFGSASTLLHTYNTTTTQTYTVTVQARCPTDNVSAQASRSITITGSGGSGGGGALGTLTNPYKINKTTTLYSNGYIPENATAGSRGAIVIPAGAKVYFEVDPVGIGTSVGNFKINGKFDAGFGSVCKLTQDRTTGAYSPEVCRGYSAFMEVVPISNKKFLYAIDNSLSTGVARDEMWAQIPL